MSERERGLSKEDALKALRFNLRRSFSSRTEENKEVYGNIADNYADMARGVGASDFEIWDVYMETTPKGGRQMLFGVWSEDVEEIDSLERLKSWAEDMIKIKEKYKLQDPLKSFEDEETLG